MAGAYTAKPAAVSAPSVPPGWNEDWPPPGVTDLDYPGIDPDPFFPAPFPPGYVPSYSLVVSGSESIAYDGAASITGTFRDHISYTTNEPDVIRWTATFTSSPTRKVRLRFSGDEEYADNISSVCVFGTYWGATPDIEFELTEEDIGGTIILTAKSAISGSYVGASLAIEVGVLTATIEFTADVATNPQWGTATEIEGQESGVDALGRVGLEWPEADIETEDEISVSKTSTTTTIQIDVFRSEVYDVRVGWASIHDGTINMAWTLTVSAPGEDDVKYTKEEVVEIMGSYNYFPSLDEEWLTIDGTTGEVTIVNP